MVESIYGGPSAGFGGLVEGYLGYAEEVIVNRSIPHLADGLKPVHRRILYTLALNKNKDLIKTIQAVGYAVAYHPHGDTSISDALYRMTDKNGSLNVPLIAGKGSFGHVWSNKQGAAPRYTEIKLGPLAAEFLNEMEGVPFVEAESAKGMEPVHLAATFPNILIGSSDGIGVGLAARMPQYNFHEVLDYVGEYIRTRSFGDDLVPDYPSGGHIVNHRSEFQKILATGKGKIKLRAKVEIVGKEIIFTEVPFGMTLEKIIEKTREADLRDVMSVDDNSDISGCRGVITCRSKNSTEQVLQELYRSCGLQVSITTNMVSIHEGVPFIGGVRGTIQRWLDWRYGVIQKMYRGELEKIASELESLSYFIRLVENIEQRDHYVDLVVNGGDASTYLSEIFPDIPADASAWIFNRRAKEFNRGGKYRDRYEDLLELQKRYNGYIANPQDRVLEDFDRLKKTFANQFPRRSAITNEDFLFVRSEEKERVDDSSCYFTITKSGFIKKTRDPQNMADAVAEIPGQANSPLIGFDEFGRILRVYGEDIPYGQTGVYLGEYGKVGDTRWMWFGLLDGSTHYLIHRDGYVGHLDTSEWVNNTRKTRLIERGVYENVGETLLEVVSERAVGPVLLVVGTTSRGLSLGLTLTNEILVKGRKSRTKVFRNASADASYDYIGFLGNQIETAEIVRDATPFYDNFRAIKDSHEVNLEVLGGHLNVGKFSDIESDNS